MSKAEIQRRKEGKRQRILLASMSGLVLLGLLIAASLFFSEQKEDSNSIDPFSFENRNEYLHFLITTHPHQAIRDDLARSLVTGEILLSYSESGIIGPGNQTAAMAVIRVLTDTQYKPTLLINPHWLASKESTVEKQLAIYHEYIHLLQLIEERVPGERFDPPNPNETITPAIAEMDFEVEAEAYLKECKLAVEIDALDNNFCKIYAEGGEIALRNFLVEEYYMKIPAFQPYRQFLLSLAENK